MTTLNVRTADPEAQRAAILANPIFITMVSSTPAQIDALLAPMTLTQLKGPISMLGQAVTYLFNVQNPSS